MNTDKFLYDLHMHSTASDGTDTPQQIIEKCHKLGLRLCAIADHDTLGGQDEAICAAEKLNVPYITAVEFSVRHNGELHLLGYGVDRKERRLREKLAKLQQARESRLDEILRKLNACGVRLTRDDVVRHAAGSAVGRPHVAQAMIEKGYATDFEEVFAKYLGEGGLCYTRREKLTQEEAMQLILDAGGLPVLAHPKFIKTDDMALLIREARAMGLKGIEAYYPSHSDAEAGYFEHLARREGLLVTGGSDYHGKIRRHTAIACERRRSPYLCECLDFLSQKNVCKR